MKILRNLGLINLILLLQLPLLAGCTDNSASPDEPSTGESPGIPSISTPDQTTDYKFDFDTFTPGSVVISSGRNTPFNYSQGGITARFSSPSDPAAFSVQSGGSTSFILSQFTGKYLYQNMTLPAILNIEFSQPLTGISLKFATTDSHGVGEVEDPTLIKLTAYTDSTETNVVGSASARGTFSTDSYPQGTLSFESAGQPFTRLKLELLSQKQGATKFLLDDITVSVAAGSVDKQTSAREVLITYTPVLIVQPDTSSILLTELMITNQGYDSFKSDPANFSMMFDGREYSYNASLSDLEPAELENGTEIKGRLGFLVPAVASGNATGFNLAYSDENSYNIQWENNSQFDSYIIIKYIPAFVTINSNNVLVVNISLENNGYDYFNSSPEYFSVLVGNSIYPCDIELSELRTYDIPDGGKLIGKLAFEVPPGSEDYHLIYSGVQLHNIQWFLVRSNHLR